MITPWKSLLLCLMVMTALAGCHKRTGLQIGDPVPSATLINFHGKSVRLPEAFKGKVVLVRFGSIDCDFCGKEILVSLEDFYHKYRDLRFVPVAINENRIEANDERLKQFEHLTYPILSDEYGLVAKQFGIISLPTTFVFDEEGIVRAKITGETELDEFEKLITTALNK